MKIAIYARVSRGDDAQNPENQLAPLRNMAAALKGEVIREYVDTCSGAKSDRAEFLRLLKDADSRRWDLLLTWSLDRLSREGIVNTLAYLKRFKRNGIAVKSLQEPWLDTRDEGISELLLAIFAWVAEQERKRIISRIRAGLETARRNGKHLGRPKGSKDKQKRSKSGYYLRYAGTTKEQRKLKLKKQKAKGESDEK